MPEAVRRVIRFCFERVDLNRVEARCIAEYTASARVMEKAGMVQFDSREQEVDGEKATLVFYEIWRPEDDGVTAGQQ